MAEYSIEVTGELEPDATVYWAGATYSVRRAREGEEPTRAVHRCCAGALTITGPPVVLTLIADDRNHGHALGNEAVA